MIENPWSELPTKSPYILPKDFALIKEHRHFLDLRLDTLPEPIVGGLNNAKVIFLALNPGFTQSDVDINMKLKKLVEGNHRNLNDPYTSENYYFAPGLEETGGFKWWTSKLKPVLNAGVSMTDLRHKVMIVEFFPYHSVNYKHMNLTLPSQTFTFEIVKQAIAREKTIVIMRSKKLWLEAVPELTEYPYLTLNSPQNVTVSPKNIGSLNFKLILSELASVE